MVNDVYRDAYDIPYMVNIVKWYGQSLVNRLQ